MGSGEKVLERSNREEGKLSCTWHQVSPGGTGAGGGGGGRIIKDIK